MRIVVVSPHRDDAAFSLSLSLECWLAQGHRVSVLNCFTLSEYAPFSDVASLHANDRQSFVSATRKREDTAWNKLLGGRLQFTDLDLLDAPIRLACGVDEVLTAEIRAGDRAVARVYGAVAKLARTALPDQLAILLPLAIGGHIDHRVVHQAGLEALKDSTLPFAFYEDLPYIARPGAGDEVEKITAQTGLALTPVFGCDPVAEPGTRVSRKRRLAECYDSQIDSETAEQIAAFSLTYDGRERLWANPAFGSSALVVHDTAGAEAADH